MVRTDSFWVHCFSKWELTSSGPVDCLVSSPRRSCLTCVCVTSTLVRVFSHCCSRRDGGCLYLHFFSEKVNQQLGLLLAAGGHCSVLLGDGRDEILAADSLLLLDQGPPSLVSHARASQFAAQVLLPFVHGPFACCHHPPAGRPMQILVPSRALLASEPRKILGLRSKTATVAKPWLVRWSGGVFLVWDVVSLEGQEA